MLIAPHLASVGSHFFDSRLRRFFETPFLLEELGFDGSDLVFVRKPLFLHLLFETVDLTILFPLQYL